MLEPCDLPEYRSIVSALPRPSTEQIHQFVDYVSGAHSWHKHLPLLPPGVPFHFFLDPYAGYRHAVGPDGRIGHQERPGTAPGLHAAPISTAEYRARFACLAFQTVPGGSALLALADGPPEYLERPAFFTDTRGRWIPPEVCDAGTVRLTAVVHDDTPQIWVWQIHMPGPEARSWPEETGGMATLDRILQVRSDPRFVAERERRRKRYHQIVDGRRPRLPEAEEQQLQEERQRLERGLVWDEDLVRLLEPEKRRLRSQMREAIQSMVALAHPDP